ncbi:transketolase [bacterium]|nr:transketolase [bacterium]
MNSDKIEDYKRLATQIRVDVLKMIYKAKSAHIGASFSMADILAVLYGGIMKVNPSDPKWEDRDRYVQSKGHAAAGLYAALAEKGFFPRDWLETYYQDGGHLMGHVWHKVPGVDVSSGALGHGLSIACGMAINGKYKKKQYRVFVMLSDGECDEGSVWEAIMFAPQHKLDNLVAIVDYNKLQALGTVKDVLDLAPLADKWRAFNWSVKEVDGHNYKEIDDALSSAPFEQGKPSCIIANTVKGKGVSYMENKVEWHYKSPDEGQLKQAFSELGVTE